MVKINKLLLKYLGINTHKDPIVYMREDCLICKSEGFNAQTRVMVKLNKRSIIATLNMIETGIYLPVACCLLPVCLIMMS